MKRRVRIAPPRIATRDTRAVKPPAKTADPHYLTPEHRAWRSEVIRRAGGQCQDREHDPRRPRQGVRLFADHIRELRDDGAALDPANGEARCGACHARVTLARRAVRMGRGV